MAEAKRPHLHVTFFNEAVENKNKSAKEGRPIFEEKEFIRIKWAGDRNRELVAPATDPSTHRDENGRRLTYKQRFPDHYKAFKENREFTGEGTPITELPFLTEAKRAELKALHIYTAEALAGLEGANLQRLGMGGRALKDQATAYLEAAQGGAPAARLVEENAALRTQMEAMQAQLNELAGKAPEPKQEAVSPFEEWADEDIKNWIKEASGEGVSGNPKHETLVRKADELNARLKSEKEAA